MTLPPASPLLATDDLPPLTSLSLALTFQVAALKGSDHRRATSVGARLAAQQKKLNLPALPTTTIGSFPQTVELRRVRREYKANK